MRLKRPSDRQVAHGDGGDAEIAPRWRARSTALIVAVLLESLVGAITQADTSLAAAVLFATPTVVLLLFYGHEIARGKPKGDLGATRRLTGIVESLGAPDELEIVVHDQAPSAIALQRSRPPQILAALSFVQGNEDSVLRGAAAIRLSELEDEQAIRDTKHQLYACGALGLVGFTTGEMIVTSSPLAVLAPLGLAFWLPSAVSAAWSRVPRGIQRYAPVDDAAVRLTGDAEAIRRALRAFAEWREETVAKLDPLGRVILRALQPIPGNGHELARAARLNPR
jgi:hypothetical protein